jgi:kynurenine formamidase
VSLITAIFPVQKGTCLRVPTAESARAFGGSGFREHLGQPIRQDTADASTVEDVESVLDEEGVSLEPGDILLLRFGWLGWYDRADRAVRESLASFPGGMGGYPSAPGLDRGERTAAWLWDRHVAAVAADCPGVESMPVNPNRLDQFLHYRLIPLLGIAVGEFFVLDHLASDCAEDKVYDGFFSAAPLHKVGGSGSPANALAIK